jgi:hypothetical protein
MLLINQQDPKIKIQVQEWYLIPPVLINFHVEGPPSTRSGPVDPTTAEIPERGQPLPDTSTGKGVSDVNLRKAGEQQV